MKAMIVNWRDIAALGMEAYWCTLKAGWEGFDMIGRLVSVKDIVDYAIQQANDGDSSAPVVDIITYYDEDDSRVVNAFYSLAEDCDLESERRKWRLVLVVRFVEKVNPSDPIDGLMSISDFWGRLGRPPGSPHEEQSQSATSPPDYYTAERLKNALRSHKAWIAKELVEIAEEVRGPNR